MRKLHLIWAVPSIWVLLILSVLGVGIALATGYPAMRIQQFVLREEA